MKYVVPTDYVCRSGYYLCNVYPEPEFQENGLMVETKPQSGTEHMYSVSWWCNNLCRAFPEIREFNLYRERLKDALMIHDLFECKIGGDIPDVASRNDEEKDTLEAKWAKEYCDLLPYAYGHDLNRDFIEMQDKNTPFGQLAYVFDKDDAVRRGLAYEVYGHCGILGTRGFESDHISIVETGTNLLSDGWFAHMIRKTYMYPAAPFFYHVMAEIFRIERGAYPHYLEMMSRKYGFRLPSILTTPASS